MSKNSTVLKQLSLAGQFDSRSEPEAIPKDGWRMVQNMRLFNMAGKLCRAEGWKKLLSGDATDRAYNNEDLHDQLLGLQIYYDKITSSTKTAGPLVVGRKYLIATFKTSDNFINVGAVVNSTGISFTATGTTPTTWTHGSILTELEADDDTVMAYPPNNPDFALSCGTTKRTRAQGRQPITFISQLESSAGNRRLAAGTQSRLYVLNERRGNWRIIGDGFGGTASDPSVRWRETRVGDYVLLTNNYDEPVYWPFDGAITGCEMQAVKKIPDLQTINVTKVAVMFEFRGIIIAANIEEDGTRKTNMVRWSGLRAPLEWIEDPGVSAAGHQELDDGEEVLAGGVLGDFAWLHTNRGIWQLSPSSDPDIVFSFTKKYSSDVGSCCIKYPFSFISIGDAHLYMAEDGIYVWSQYKPRPELLKWIHSASAILYDDLNKSNCAIHTAGYDPRRKEVYFSCALGTDSLPSVTLVCNIEYRHAFKLDHGFTALAPFVPDDRPNVFDWLIENCIISQTCLDSTDAAALGAVDLKQGAAVAITTPPCTTFAQSVCKKPVFGPNLLPDTYGVENYFTLTLEVGKTYVWTKGDNEVDVRNQYDGLLYTDVNGGVFTVVNAPVPYAGRTDFNGICGDCPVTGKLQEFTGGKVVEGILVEDPGDGKDCDTDSICALIGNKAIPELCRKCEGESVFIGASSSDWCLKQFGLVYYRERHVGNGVYVNDGYQSRLLKCLPGNSDMLAISDVLLHYTASIESSPLKMNLRVGASARAEDPLRACGIQWSDEGGRDIDCIDNDKAMQWATWAADSFLYLDFTIDGIGGASCYSSLEFSLQKAY